MGEQVTFIIGYMGRGGAERVVSVLANNFVKKGIKVNIITIISDIVDYSLDDRINYYNVSYYSKFKLKKIIIRCIKTRKILKRIGKTKIISFLHIPILYTIFSNIFLSNEVCVSERNNPYMEPRSTLARKIRDISYKFVDKVVFQTKEAKEYFPKSIQKKGYIILNPIKDDLPKRCIANTKKEIVGACRLEPQKNVKMLINAFNKLQKEYKDYKLIIYGEGYLRNELENQIKKLKLQTKVFLPGFTKDVHEKMRNCEMYVSSSDYEGISNSMLEALAIGVPTVVTDCPIGGARMVIQNNINGILTPVGDEESLYLAMKKIIEDKNFANLISKNAIKIRERLNSDKICEEWLKIL